MHATLSHPAPFPARGSFADGYEPVARVFAQQLKDGHEIGSSFAVYRKGQCIIDLWGGLADVASGRAWERDTRIVLFSVTKGFTSMALHMLADRGLLDFEARVADYWPEFARNGKQDMTVSTLLCHRGGLAGLDTALSLLDCTNPEKSDYVRDLLAAQRPAWPVGEDQGYHAITFGMYARELFERASGGEDLGAFLRRELLEPLGSDVYLGTPPALDRHFATLYPPKRREQVAKMLSNAVAQPRSTEARILQQFVTPRSTMRQALLNPAVPNDDLAIYNRSPVRESVLAWGSATGSAQGIARAYLPFASGGGHGEVRYLREETLRPVWRRLSWSPNDLVLQKPIGWSHGFVKDERHLFSPNPEAFGHPGMGGSLGWADPVEELAIGYAVNRMDWRIRSPYSVNLCRALYDCEPIVERG